MISNKKIIFVSREFLVGGAGYLTLRHIQQLISDYDIDLLITGPTDQQMLNQLPPAVQIYTFNFNDSYDDKFIVHFFIENRTLAIFSNVYSAVLGTAILPDFRAASIMSLLKAKKKFFF